MNFLVDTLYLELVMDIINNGSLKQTRSGEVLSIFGKMLKFDLKDGLPMLTTKKMFSRGCIHELLWFLKGSTNIKYLVENNVHIWDDDAYRYYKELVTENNRVIDSLNTKDFFGYQKEKLLDKESFIANVIGETHKTYFNGHSTITYLFGDLGEVYGKQWRSFGVTNKDQIKQIIETLKTNPDDRRMLCLAYNPDVTEKVALPPCHLMFQFYTRELSEQERLNWLWEHSNNEYDEWKSTTHETLDKLNVPKRELSLMWVQRSVDVCLGLPFNILSYSILLSMVAQVVNMSVGVVTCSLGDCHIYTNHLDGVKEQVSRSPLKYNLPKLKLNPNIKKIDDFTIDDITIENYSSYPKINFPLSVGL